MIDATYVKWHHHSSGVCGENQAISKTEVGLIRKYTSYLNKQNIKPVIPPKRNRLHQRGYKGFKKKRQ